jgi:MerR family transcriptional regulator/heat shock protein HspR
LAGVDIILRLKESVDTIEKDMLELRQELLRAKNSQTVSHDKALVTKKSIYEMIIFQQ